MANIKDGQYRYKAFISYNHRDTKFAKYLHTKLESYSSPTPSPNTPKKPLFPIFLDESELSAGSTLTEAIQEAIGSSQFFIVICSENSISSKWVKAELALMRELHEYPQIIGVIPNKDGDETHLKALFGEATEHLAADFRQGNNKQLQLSKIIATMTGMELDALYKREARRKNKQMAILGASLSAVAISMTGLAANTALAEKEAVRQRQQSEQVIAFMIDEFRDDLQSLDKLDLLSDVGERAQDYFEDRDLSLLSDESVILQSRTLRQLSDVDEKRGDLTDARLRIKSAHEASKIIYQRRPEDKEAINEHAENLEFWAYLNYQIGDLNKAKELSVKAQNIYNLGLVNHPTDKKMVWKRDVSDQRIGVMILQSGNAVEARPYFEKTLRAIEKQNERRDLTEDELYEYVDVYTWYIRSLPDDTPLSFLLETRQTQLELFEKMRAQGAGNIRNRAEKLNIKRAVVKLLLDMGKDARAESLMQSIQVQFKDLLKHDPSNIGWRRHLMRSKLTLARLRHAQGDVNARNALLEDVNALWQKTAEERWLATTDIVLGVDCLNAYSLFESDSLDTAVADLERAEKDIRDYRKDKIRPRDKYNIASLMSVKAELLNSEGRKAEAQETQRDVLNLLSGKDSYTTSEQKLKLSAYRDLKMTERESSLRRKLEKRGFVF